jgi:IS1 family transposase
LQQGTQARTSRERASADLFGVGRLELDELWSYVGKKQRNAQRHETEKGNQWTYVALASSSRAIVSYRTGKRDSANTQEFMANLRERVLGTPEISSDGFKPYLPAVRSEFNGSAHGIIEPKFGHDPNTKGTDDEQTFTRYPTTITAFYGFITSPR